MIIINLLKILIMNMSTFWRQQRIDKIGIYFMLQQEYSFIMPVIFFINGRNQDWVAQTSIKFRY